MVRREREGEGVASSLFTSDARDTEGDSTAALQAADAALMLLSGDVTHPATPIVRAPLVALGDAMLWKRARLEGEAAELEVLSESSSSITGEVSSLDSEGGSGRGRGRATPIGELLPCSGVTRPR